MKDKSKFGENTKLVHMGREPDEYFGVVNTPASRSSTLLYKSLDDYESPKTRFRYGPYGTPITKHFEEAMAELEGGYNAVVTPCGMGAIAAALTAYVKTGDHILVTDSLYPPTRDYCENVLRARFGVDVEYYDPTLGAGIEALIRDNTKLIHIESPGSATFETQDVPAIAKIAKAKGVLTVMDNSYAGGWLFNPIKHGIDIAAQSCSKYVGGHSDVMLGVVVASTEDLYNTLKTYVTNAGICAGADEIYLALRGLRTMPLRFKQVGESVVKVIDGIKDHGAVEKIFHPTLPDNPGHGIWKRDYRGANGVFTLVLKPVEKDKLRACADALELFPIGSSWGGYESLLQPQYLKKYRSARPWPYEGAVFRFNVGLEDPDDLIADLKQALDKLL